MKCTHCLKDTRYRDRSTHFRCHHCQHPFAFEPKTDKHHVSDEMFSRVALSLSDGGRLSFTKRNLYYGLEARLSRRLWSVRRNALPTAVIALVLTLSVGGVFYAFQDDGEAAGWVIIPLWVIMVTFIALVFASVEQLKYRRTLRKHGVFVGPSPFEQQYLARWLSVHGPIGGLIDADVVARSVPPDDSEPELAEYSISRAVVTDSADMAAVLIANRAHFENQCLVFSEDGYPPTVSPRARAMLARSEAPQVLALHDASIEGVSMTRRLRTAAWLPSDARIVDLGLLPEQATQLALPALRGEPRRIPPGIRSDLGPDVIRWLESGRSTELAATPPWRVLRAIARGFAGPEPASPDESSGAEAPAAAERQDTYWWYWGDNEGREAEDTHG